MALRNPALLSDSDVLALTRRGDEELRGSETSLSPAEIELLVRIDGRSTLAQIKAGVRLLAADAVADAAQKLVNSGLVQQTTAGALASQGVPDIFSIEPLLNPSPRALSKARTDTSNSVSTLQKQGYFVRIARRPATGRRLPGNRAPLLVVVEDEPSLAKFLRHYLELEGYEVRLAMNRSEIVAAFRAPPAPDLVLLDVVLPDADGFDVLLKMRAHPALKTVPVIMLTAKATRESVLKGLAGGANGYITKPFEAETLVKAVHTVLGQPQDPVAGRGGDAWLKRGPR